MSAALPILLFMFGAPEERSETVVTAMRMPRPLRNTPQTTIVIPQDEIDRSPTLTIDNLIRTVPSAATFRRSSSVVADPTSQGLNLRGLGPSGVSRSLVLVDGVPMNAPFGGWIYWRSLPRLSLDRVEIVPTGGSSLYGSAALGGVVQMVTRDPQNAVEGDLALGTSRTLFGALHASQQIGSFAASFEGELLKSDGWPVVAKSDRGAIDADAPSAHGNALATVSWSPVDAVDLTLRGGFFREDQSGGTTFTNADVMLAHASLATSIDLDTAGAFEVALFVRGEEFAQQRARPNDDRSQEALAAEQRVPADEEGASLIWRAPAFIGNQIALGVDARRVQGVSHERLYPPVIEDGSTTARSTGGEQHFVGAFAQDVVEVTSWLDLDAALRFDLWRNVAGRRDVTRGDGSIDVEEFDDRIETELSPRAGVLVRPVDALLLRASAFKSFRAPTLNELYRPFQVGTIFTAANEGLTPERAWGGEAGVEVRAPFPVIVRTTGFFTWLDAPIVNVTIADGQRQRQNVGAARVFGVELGADWRVARGWTLIGAYTFVDPRIIDGPGALEGKLLAHDPQHRLTGSVQFHEPRLFTAMVQVRALGEQYEDDLNTLLMPGLTVIDASLSRHLAGPLEPSTGAGARPRLELFVAVENVLNAEYLVGRAGVDTVGQPFSGRVGVRVR